MAKKNFILLSMEDDKIKKISNVISNESCRKILDLLAEKEATESEIASRLDIPISTVHYNLQQLVETGLIDANEYHYSKKGKEVNHYRLANKYIIIAPKKTYGIKEKLKSILPVALITGAVALVLQFTQKLFVHGGVTEIFTNSKQTLIRESVISQVADNAAQQITPLMESSQPAATNGVVNSAQAVPHLVNKTTEYLTQPEVVVQANTILPSAWSNIALWFFAGAVFALLVYFIVSVIRKDVE